MPKVEEPKSISLFVQWELDPFKLPQSSQHKIANTTSAVEKTGQCKYLVEMLIMKD